MGVNPAGLLVVSVSLSRGGAQRFVSTLLVHLNRSRIRPSLALLRDDIGYPLPADVPVTLLGYQNRWMFGRAVKSLSRRIASARPEVVLSNGAATSIVTGLALSRSSHQPAWIARIDNNPRFHDRHLRGLILDRVYPRAWCFVANSRGLHTGFIERYPFAAGRVEVLLNPVDFARIDVDSARGAHSVSSTDAPVVISVGRLFPQKRMDLLIDAFARIRRGKLAVLWICGDGPEREKLEQRVASHGIQSSVRFWGHVSNPYSLMRRADLFALTSDYEGLPNALIEAQGLGLPAVSTRCPYGPDEIIADGETGFLVEPGDIESLSKAMQTLVQDARLRRSMGVRAARRARCMFDSAERTRGWQELVMDAKRDLDATGRFRGFRFRFCSGKRRHRLLIVSPSLSDGGSERFASWLASGVDRAAFEPHVCLLRNRVTYPLASDVPVHLVERDRPWHVPRAVRRLGQLLRVLKPDVVVGTMAFVNRLLGVALRLDPSSLRWIARFVADPAPDDGLAAQWLTRTVCGRADCFVANSRGLQNALCRFYPFMRGHTRCIHNPVDFDVVERMSTSAADVPSSSGVPVVLFVGRLVRQKRPDMLLEAFARALHQVRAELWLVGTGRSEAAMRRQVERLGIGTHVRFFGFASNPYPYMRRADVCVLTSDYEGLPNSLIEAQGLGVPAVATRCPYGPDEIVVPGESGILTGVNDVEAFADGLVRLLGDPQLRRVMGQSARIVARARFGADRIIRHWEELLRRVPGGA